jgi:hypothetical protein
MSIKSRIKKLELSQAQVQQEIHIIHGDYELTDEQTFTSINTSGRLWASYHK